MAKHLTAALLLIFCGIGLCVSNTKDNSASCCNSTDELPCEADRAGGHFENPPPAPVFSESSTRSSITVEQGSAFVRNLIPEPIDVLNLASARDSRDVAVSRIVHLEHGDSEYLRMPAVDEHGQTFSGRMPYASDDEGLVGRMWEYLKVWTPNQSPGPVAVWGGTLPPISSGRRPD